jgi:hypothetical protein
LPGSTVAPAGDRGQGAPAIEADQRGKSPRKSVSGSVFGAIFLAEELYETGVVALILRAGQRQERDAGRAG